MFKKFQLIIVKTNNNIIESNKLINNSEYILWFSKKVPEKFKNSMQKEFKKEIWEIMNGDVDNIINNNLCILTTNVDLKGSNKKDFMVIKLF